MGTVNPYALILGSSSGFGKSVAVELGKIGYNIYGVHLDRASNRDIVQDAINEIEETGAKCKFFNMNAADDSNRKEVIEYIREDFKNDDKAELRVLFHSLAFGALGPFISDTPENQLTRKKIEMTINVMANSLVYWSQDLFSAGFLPKNSRIYAMTSNGSSKVMNQYGAVAAAKSALEAYIRQLAVELAPYGVTCNSILAGFTETPASKVIPGFDKNLVMSRRINPHNRNTYPEDVAKVISLLQDERSAWITGQVIGVDGGEGIVVFKD